MNERKENWSAAIQNLGALAAIVILAMADKISGEWAAGMILSVTGVIALPAVLKGGKSGPASDGPQGGNIGTIGIIALAGPGLRIVLTALTGVGKL